MSAEENKAILRRYVEEVFNQGNIHVIDELFAPEYVTLHCPTFIMRSHIL